MVENSAVKKYLKSITYPDVQWWKLYAFRDKVDEWTWFEFELNSKPQDKPTERGRKPEEKPPLVLDAIAAYAHEKILIVGRPGAGKTTLLARIAWQSAQKAQQDETAPIPVLVELKLYGEAGIWELIQTALENRDLYLEIADIKQLVKCNRLLLLADGFNELLTERARAEFKRFCGRKLRVIVTSRDSANDLGLERKLELQSPSPLQVEQFLEERLPNCDRARLKKLGDRVKDLGQTPLMIWMLYSIFRAKNEIPKTRGEAYQTFTALYTERAKDGIDLTESQSILSKFAFEMMQSQRIDDPTEVEARSLLGSEKILKLLVNNHLLQWQGELGKRRVRFCHQSLQEYYAAEGLRERLPDLSKGEGRKELQHKYLNYLKWTEPIALMLGFPEVSEKQALEVVRSGLEVDLWLGARLAGEVKSGLQQKTVSHILDLEVPQLLKFQLLGATHSSVAVPRLIDVFQTEDNIYRLMDAAFALRSLGSKAAVPALLCALAHKNEMTIARAYPEVRGVLLSGERLI